MVNPILQNLSKSQSSNSVQNLMKASKNPKAYFQQALTANPQYNQIMKYIADNGGDPETAFYKMAQERGIDPNEIIKMMKGD